jgi:hypothetical protein
VFVRKDDGRIREYGKFGEDTLASVMRSFNELNRSLQGIAEEMTEASKRSVGRAIEIQAQLAKKAYEAYISEVSKLGKMYLGCGSLMARTENFPNVGLKSTTGQRTAAHHVSAGRKTGKASKPRSASKRQQKRQ